MKASRFFFIAFSLLYLAAPFVASYFFNFTRNDHGLIYLIHNMLAAYFVYNSVKHIFERRPGHVSVRDVGVAQVACSLGLMGAVLLSALLFIYFELEGKVPVPKHASEIFIMITLFMTGIFLHTTTYLKDFYFDLDLFITKLRFSKKEYLWYEACEVSSVGLATIETDKLSATITKQGKITVRAKSDKESDVNKWTDDLLKMYTWEPVNPSNNVIKLKDD